ncbi:MAG: VTT domain-containing protein [Syntrophales bacterium]
MPHRETISVEGKNCWFRARSGRVSFIVDAKDYFDAFAFSVEQAKYSVLITGWDIDSRLQLRPGGESDRFPGKLGDFLNAIVSKRKDLHIYILIWDFSMIYLFEREFMPVFRLNWRNHPRIHFRFDGNHPAGAAHHQKIVVVDDCIAFSGGLDLTARRWDTAEHRPDDPRRIDPWGAPYQPFHDVQIAVDGEAAFALGRIVRERWYWATGQRIPVFARSGFDPWPAGLKPDLQDIQVAISRTIPKWGGRPEVREVEALFLDMIRAARKKIYIENQYVTSAKIGEALAARLRQPDGPEVVMVVSHECSGWLEQSTMGVYRARLLKNLRRADGNGRLFIYYPALPRIEIHSKVLIVDDDMLRIGSANLSNRSMGIDTECDLMIEAAGEHRIREAIAGFRNRLLGEHLGVEPSEISQKEISEGSLGGAVENIRRSTGKIEPLSDEKDVFETIYCDTIVCDPERPINADQLLAYMLPEDIQKPEKGRLMSLVAVLAALGAIAAAWHWTPLSVWINPDVISAFLLPFQDSFAMPLLITVAYIAGGFVIPVTILVIMTVLFFSPASGFFYSLLGCIASASVSYGIGYILGRDMIRRLAGKKTNRVSRHITRHGFIAVIFLRLAAIAPFTVINLIAGASRVRFKDYFFGTLIGMTPGVFALSFFGDRLRAAIRYPNTESLFILAGIVTVFLIAGGWITKRFGNYRQASIGMKQ